MKNKFFMLFVLQLKTAFGELPKIFLGTAVFSLLLFFFAAGATAAGSRNKEHQKMQVAVVMPSDSISEEVREENVYIRAAFDFLQGIETVSSVCSFAYEEYEQALDGLSSGFYTAVIVVPQRFISGILNGENIPARIIFEKGGVNTTSAIFRDMLRAGASDLSTAQAGIYAVENVCRQLPGAGSAVAEADAYLNGAYFAYALDRNVYFKVMPLSAADGLTTVQFYAATGIVLLFILGGVTCVELLRADPPVLAAALKRSGIVSGLNHIFKVAAVTAVFFCLFGVAFILAALAGIRYPQVRAVFEPGNILIGLAGLFVLLAAVLSMAGLVYKFAGKALSGLLLLFLLSVVMMFASGCFVPSSMLPPVVAQLGQYLPTAWFFKLCSQMMSGNVEMMSIAVNGCYAIIFCAAAAAADYVRERG